MTRRVPRILLIEEDPTLMQLTAFRLELLEYQVIEKSSGEAAFAWLENEMPDLVVVNQFLPDMDGIDLLDRLSNDTRTSEIPVMLLSAEADLDNVQRAFNAGADEYLVTPYDPMVLETKVDRLTVGTTE